jgi:hypothetical protein
VWKWCLFLLATVLVAASLLPVQQVASAPFASLAFEHVWAAQQGGRLDLWGSSPLAWRIEPYAEAPAGRRLVQYFDRGRMELQTRAGSGQQSVTQGLLAWEMTTGQVALGDTLTEPLAPPVISIDGGELDPGVPTYAGLSRVVQRPGQDRTATTEPISEWIDADGNISSGAPPVPIRFAQYIAATGHNLPQVTLELFSERPFDDVPWVEVLGYPISEPYWALYRHDGVASPALIQVFQRRILVYTPDRPPEQQFTVPNTGRHYYRWRYRAEATQLWPQIRLGAPARHVVTAPELEAGVYAQGLDDPVGLAVSPDGQLLILTGSGTVLRVEREDASGAASEYTTFASGLVNPRGLAVHGGWVYVTDDQGILRLMDVDGDGVAERMERISIEFFPIPGPAGAPVVDEQGRIFVTGVLRGRLDAADQQPQVYQVVAPTVRPVSGEFQHPGPLLAWGRLLLVMEQGDSSASRLVWADTGEGSGMLGGTTVLALPTGFTANGALVYASQLWSELAPGTILIAARSASGGVVFWALPGSDESLPDLTELAAGFTDPAALAAGLDGVIYVADAATGEVVKLAPKARRLR